MRITFVLISAVILSSCTTSKKYADLGEEEKAVNVRMDSWHAAAAKADEDTFFTILAKNGVYIGTDASERWTGTEMKAWSKQYFERDTAWAFTPLERNVSFAEDGKTAWFDELLDTWMGTCRGSGVLQKRNGEWELVHYHLAIAVPNDVVQDYLKLLDKQKAKKP